MNFKEACLTVADLLEAAPELWTSGAYARDVKGLQCDPLDERAAKWCAFGALVVASGLSFVELDKRLLRRGIYRLHEINDHKGLKATIRALRKVAK